MNEKELAVETAKQKAWDELDKTVLDNDGSDEYRAMKWAWSVGYDAGVVRQEPHWIPCSERLPHPDAEGTYEVSKMGIADEKEFTFAADEFFNGDEFADELVYAWREKLDAPADRTPEEQK